MGCRVGSQNVCFCDPNGQLACEGCQAPDGGPVADAGVMTCPANANRTACDTPMAFCTLACGGGGNNVETCRCRAGGGGNADAGATWQCANACN
jgi:hypothetical protein